MMAFFLTMPIKRMMPMSAMMLNSVLAQQQSENGADSSGRQRGKNGDRVNEAFVQDAENDVDGDQSGENQDGFIAERFAERPRQCLETWLECWAGRPTSDLARLMALTASPSEASGARLKDKRDHGKLALMIQRQSAGSGGDGREGARAEPACRWKSARRCSSVSPASAGIAGRLPSPRDTG